MLDQQEGKEINRAGTRDDEGRTEIEFTLVNGPFFLLSPLRKNCIVDIDVFSILFGN